MTATPALLLTRAPLPWWLDATRMGLTAEALDSLPWARVFAEQRALEAGAIANADEQRQVGHYWLRAPEIAPTLEQARAIGETVEAVRAFAEGVRSGAVPSEDGHPFTDVLHIGIGGSALGPALLLDAIPARREGLRVHVLDNTDPDGIARVLAEVRPRLRSTLALIVSKSGGTAETRNAALLVRDAFLKAGFHPPAHQVAITTEGSTLHQQATREGWLATFPMWDWVGGRFSVTSAVGLLPAELAGIDTHPLIAGAAAMDAWTRGEDWRENPAALLAGCWYLAGNGRGERAMVMLPYADRLLLLSRYLQQLVMESIGKQHARDGREVHAGLTVYGNKGSTDQHAYVQQLRDGRDDFFVSFVQVLGDGAGSPMEVEPGSNTGDFLQGFLLGTRRALTAAGRPSLTLTLERVDAYALGGLIALFERAVGAYASLIDVNAYHQPGVEAGKKAAREVLDLSHAARKLLRARSYRLDELAEALGADPVEVLYLLERLVATGRATRAGDPPHATWRCEA